MDFLGSMFMLATLPNTLILVHTIYKAEAKRSSKMNQSSELKAVTLLVSLALSSVANHAIAAYVASAETYNNLNWQTPSTAEFDKIDTSGNGLILPNEATKAKAFNTKTFAKADVDRDGTIDQREYVYARTGAWPDEEPVNLISDAVSQLAVPPVQAEEIVIGQKNIDTQQSGELKNNGVKPQRGDVQLGELNIDEPLPEPIVVAERRTIGNVVDDTIITTKAKAAILGAEDLKSLQIGVETRDSEVLLSGFVDSEAAKDKAAELVTKIEGVQSVINSLIVKGN